MTEGKKKAPRKTHVDTSKVADAKRKASKSSEAKGPAAKQAAAPKPKKTAEKKSDKAKKADSGVKKSGKIASDIRLYDVIQRPVITEKATRMSEQNKVVFRIAPHATKKDVKAAVEALFGVKVTKVNTIALPGKSKRFRGREGQRQDVRKAIVTLAEGQSIDVAAGLK